MKAEHRKELQTNVLANKVGNVIRGLRSKPNPSSLVVAVFVVGSVLIFAGWHHFSGKSLDSRGQLWAQLENASSLEEVKSFADSNAKTVPGLIARFQEARVLQQSGLENLFLDFAREKALTNLQEARKLYETLAQKAADRPLLQQEALMGVAKCKEAVGDLDEALAAYREVVKATEKQPASAAGIAAADRVKKLESDEGRKEIGAFYSKLKELARSKPLPPPFPDFPLESSKGGPVLPPAIPSSELPPEPKKSVPGALGPELPPPDLKKGVPPVSVPKNTGPQLPPAPKSGPPLPEPKKTGPEPPPGPKKTRMKDEG